jgi:hypothetical protein
LLAESLFEIAVVMTVMVTTSEKGYCPEMSTVTLALMALLGCANVEVDGA